MYDEQLAENAEKQPTMQITLFPLLIRLVAEC